MWKIEKKENIRPWNTLYIIYNATEEEVETALPKGEWEVPSYERRQLFMEKTEKSRKSDSCAIECACAWTKRMHMRWIYGKQDWNTLKRGLENNYLLTNGLGGFSALT